MSELQPHQQKIAEKRYFQNNEESWYDMVEDRVWPTIMAQEINEYKMLGTTRLGEILDRTKNILLNRQFLFNTPTWINAGMPGARTLSACFVGELKDTMIGDGGILDCSNWFGSVQKFGGGTGIDLSELRSKGTPIASTHGKACGPLMVLKYLAATSQMITQGGARDGANMAVMSIYHEDIIDFIKCKSIESKYLLELPIEIAQQKIDSGQWTKEDGEEYIEYCRKMGTYQLFNVSVAVDNNFMNAVKAYKVGRSNTFEPAPTKSGEYIASQPWQEILPCGMRIGNLWDMIVEQAHRSGDPGLLFMERAQEFARFHSPYIPHATNPCGEQFLPEHGSCNLGSIDLAKFVDPRTNLPWKDRIEWENLGPVIKDCVRMLDNVVEINKHPVLKIESVNSEERRIGLGVMGWHDLLFQLKIPYDSEEALEVCHTVAKFFKTKSHEGSVELARERGAFPLHHQVRVTAQAIPLDMAKVNQYEIDEPVMPKEPRRNATVTTVAPTGTISLMAGCSSGIEPHFALGYEHQGLREHGGLGYIWASDTLRKMFENNYGLTKDEWGSPDEFENYIRKEYNWKPANEIDIKWHVLHQAIWQKYIDNSISKTLNLNNNATVEDVENTYILSYSEGTKGSTIYRDGCKPFQVLNASRVNEEEKSSPELSESFSVPVETVVPGQRIRKKREKMVHGVTFKEKTPDGSMYVTINRGVRDEPFELFAQIGKAGGKAHAYTEAIARLISLALQYNIPMEDIAKELRGIKGGDPVGMGPHRVLSAPDGIGKSMQEFLEHENVEADIADNIEAAPVVVPEYLVDVCPECKSELVKQEGCSGGMCMSCGLSKCQ